MIESDAEQRIVKLISDFLQHRQLSYAARMQSAKGFHHKDHVTAHMRPEAI